MQDNRIYIFDTTLRDGQQSPGAGMSFEDNLCYASYADALGIDILEAGFPAASQTDFDVVRTIAQNLQDTQSAMTVAALCQLREEQVIKTMEALRPRLADSKARVHTYLPVDPNLMHASLGAAAQQKDKLIHELHRLVAIATHAGFEVEFSPEGYSRMGVNFDFVTDLIRAAVSAGCRVINCPDTIGGASRIEGDNYFVRHMQRHADIIAREFPQQHVVWSMHCHNDFGLALDNSINGVLYGPATQIEGCINGVGERAGNVALEQCIMYIKQFGLMANPTRPYYTHIHLPALQRISDFVAEKMLPRQPHTPIVGDNATRHSSGGHTNAILKNPLAYQPFDPHAIGAQISFVFGPLSGSSHAKQIIEAHGYVCTHEEKAVLAQAIKNYYADRRKGITDAELMLAYRHYRSPLQLTQVDYATDRTAPHIVISGDFFGQLHNHHIPMMTIDALLAQCIALCMPMVPVTLLSHQTTQTSDPHMTKYVADVTIKTAEHPSCQGTATHEDAVIALVTACIDAMNQAHVETHFKEKNLTRERVGQSDGESRGEPMQ